MNVFYEPSRTTAVYHRNLPHWLQEGRLYFVTFRLANSLPAEAVEQFRRERGIWEQQNHEPYTPAQRQEYHRLFSQRIEDWLDTGQGECILTDPQCAGVVTAALAYFDGRRYQLDHWVIMPNHIHVLVLPALPYVLPDILHSWKSYTAHQINKARVQAGNLWQHKSFDHIVRSPEHLEKFRAYIVENAARFPGKAVLSQGQIKVI